MKNVTYKLIEGTHEYDDGGSKSYGIAVCPSGSMTNETASVLELIQDITTDKNALNKLINLCNSLELSPLHIRDVIEDFLVR